MKTLRVFEAFSGYGSQSMALKRLGVDYEVIGISEIDKYALQAYMAVHGETPNYGDISKIDWTAVPDFDFLTYSFPCTDISSAGLQKGLEEGSGTRSSLLWECKKAIEAKKPKYLLMENVKALTYKKFKPYLDKWLDYLKDLGYTNFAKILNAKNYGVPQNRERIFVVSVLGEAEYSFPEGFELGKRLKDVLEKEVDESFYLKEGIINTFVRRTIEAKAKGNGFAFILRDGEDIAAVVKCRAGSQIEDNFIKEPVNPITCAMRGRNPDNPSDRNPGIELEQRLELGGDIANCITTVQKDSLVAEPNVLTPKRTEYGKSMRKDYDAGRIKESRHNMTQLEPRTDGISNTITTVQKDNLLAEPKLIGGIGVINFGKQWRQGNRIYDSNGIAMCLMAQPIGNAGGNSYLYQVEENEEERLNDLCAEIEPLNADDDGLCRTIKSHYYKNSKSNFTKTTGSMTVNGATDGYRIRKLTPRECFRLMGVSEIDIDKIQSAGISKTQQYKMAGNIIVVDVLLFIFKNLFKENTDKTD